MAYLCGKFNIISRIQMMSSGFFYAVLDGDTKDIQQKIQCERGCGGQKWQSV
nr:MAG TPA: hypothetical protein [Caudoviricetes sp.]